MTFVVKNSQLGLENLKIPRIDGFFKSLFTFQIRISFPQIIEYPCHPRSDNAGQYMPKVAQKIELSYDPTFELCMWPLDSIQISSEDQDL
jgi:hypothetical protein